MNLTLSIYDHSFKLACEDSQERILREAAKLVHQKLLAAKASSPKLDTERLAILVALELCQQNLVHGQHMQEFNQQMSEQQKCIQLIEQITQTAQLAFAEQPENPATSTTDGMLDMPVEPATEIISELQTDTLTDILELDNLPVR